MQSSDESPFSTEQDIPERRQRTRPGGILRIIHTMAELYRLLPQLSLTEADRKAAASQMIDNAPRLVGAMIRLLEAHGASLPEANEDPDVLREIQERADAYKLLRAHLFQLYVLANDAYLAHQAAAVRRGREALRRVRLGSRLLSPGDPLRVLRDALIARVETFDPKSALFGKKGR